MNIHELIEHQQEWEKSRGIKNQNYNLDRTQMELDEAKNESDPFKRLVEMVDVLVVLSGGMAALCEELDLPFEQVSQIVKDKLLVNSEKYLLSTFETHTVETAISRSRHYWNIDPLEWEIGNDYY